MSFVDDDDEFEELDSATLQELDAIEAAVVGGSSSSVTTSNATTPTSIERAARLGKLEHEIPPLKPPTARHSSIFGSLPEDRLGQASRTTRRFQPAWSSLKPALDQPIDLACEYGNGFVTEPNTPSPQRPGKPADVTPAYKPSEADSFTIDAEENFIFDEDTLQQIDRVAAAALSGRPVVPTNKLTRQITLTGDILPRDPPRSFTRTKSSNGPQNFPAPKMKMWNHQTALSRTASRALSNTKVKGENLEGEIELPPLPVPGTLSRLPRFESLKPDAQLTSDGPPPPMTLKCDPVAAREWIYPLNHPKRDYQYNIVRRALFDNTLVALPTGLGKTFVAGVVMLNYYRWFPKGKIVFLAPTKPLVAQQIDASHQTCGIPGDDAAELTGFVKDDRRALLWDHKRVFYLTPQTFVNDLRKIPSLAFQVVLIVVDEAHRATGGYAYSVAIRDMMVLNPHFRVLALTATPGSNRDAVQAVVDNMHINHIEIRDEQSLDLRRYVHKKKLTQHVVTLPETMTEIADTIVKLMERLYIAVGQFIPGAVMRTMNEYRALKAMSELRQNDRWAIGILSNLASLARARTYLYTQSLEMCYEALLDLESGTKSDGGKRKYPQKKLAEDPLFQTIMQLFKQCKQASTGSMVHPKMDRLRSLLLQYFAAQPPIATDSGSSDRPAESKVMVFTSYRRTVEQIVDQLNLDAPIIRAHRFIGQAATKDGVKGLSQKEQLKVIEEFKKGMFNALICTSIGEEGLDIGEVDYIVCYDSHKAPIKMLQRIGRTGRKKDGDIAVLVAEGKEETNFEKAKEAYSMVQNSITKGDRIELYSDVPRLLPADIHPQPREMVMPIVGYKREVSNTRASKSMGSIDKYVTKTRPPKEPKLTAKERKKMLAEAAALLDADSDEMESLDLHLEKTKGKRKAKDSFFQEKSPRKPSNSKKANSALSSDEESTTSRKKKLTRVEAPRELSDDEEPQRKAIKKSAKKKDADADPGPSRRKPEPKASRKRRVDDTSELLASPARRKKRRELEDRGRSSSSSPDVPLRTRLLTSQTSGFVTGTGRKLVPSISSAVIDISSDGEDLLTRNTGNEPNPEPSLGSASSSLWTRPSSSTKAIAGAQEFFTKNRTTPPSTSFHEPSRNSPNYSIDICLDNSPKPSTSQTVPRPSGARHWLLDSDSDDSPVMHKVRNSHKLASFDSFPTTYTDPASVAPELSSSPIRPPGHTRRGRSTNKKSGAHALLSETDEDEHRLEALDEVPVPGHQHNAKNGARRRRPVYDRNNGFVAMEADLSGEDAVGGSTDTEGEEDEYDRAFIADGNATQRSDYDQSAMYLQGLQTQPPEGFKFANRPVRIGAFGQAFGVDKPPRRPVHLSSSPPRGSEDAYEFDSFVVEESDFEGGD